MDDATRIMGNGYAGRSLALALTTGIMEKKALTWQNKEDKEESIHQTIGRGHIIAPLVHILLTTVRMQGTSKARVQTNPAAWWSKKDVMSELAGESSPL